MAAVVTSACFASAVAEAVVSCTVATPVRAVVLAEGGVRIGGVERVVMLHLRPVRQHHARAETRVGLGPVHQTQGFARGNRILVRDAGDEVPGGDAGRAAVGGRHVGQRRAGVDQAHAHGDRRGVAHPDRQDVLQLRVVRRCVAGVADVHRVGDRLARGEHVVAAGRRRALGHGEHRLPDIDGRVGRLRCGRHAADGVVERDIVSQLLRRRQLRQRVDHAGAVLDDEAVVGGVVVDGVGDVAEAEADRAGR